MIHRVERFNKRRANVKNSQEISDKLMEIENQLTELNKTLFDLNTALIFKTPDSYNNHRFDYVINALRLTRDALIIHKKSIENIRMLYTALSRSEN